MTALTSAEYVEKHWPGLLASAPFSADEWITLPKEAKAAYLAQPAQLPRTEETAGDRPWPLAVVALVLMTCASALVGPTAVVLAVLAGLLVLAVRRVRGRA